jgi:predicted dienelactone hydrolase
MMAKSWRDPRVKAAFAMAPAWSWLFNEESLRKISIPVYLIAAEGDRVLVSRTNAGLFAHSIPHAIYQEIPGKADHYIFISALSEKQREKADPSGKLNFILEDDATVDRRWIQFEVAEEAARFFNSVLR